MKDLYTKIFYTLLLFFVAFAAHSQVIKSLGTPSITNYSKSEYLGAHQVWGMQQDSVGRMFFATFTALVEFDGREWKQYPSPKKSNIRSIGKHEGALYSAGIATVGKWERTVEGGMEYHVIVDQTNEATEKVDEFWRLHSFQGKLIAQSFHNLVVFENDEVVMKLGATGQFQFSFQVNNRFFIQDTEHGLYELVENKLELVLSVDVLKNREVWGMFSFDHEELLIATADGELLEWKDEELMPWKNDANRFLRKNSIFSVNQLDDSHIAIGTILNGVIVLNAQGKIIQHINRNKGLQNNTVLSMYSDLQQNLWLGLDNGITHVQLASPYTYINDPEGKLGAVYTTTLHKKQLYVGTNQGLFSIDTNKVNAPLASDPFQFVKKTQGQVWCLTKMGNELICGHNKGVYSIGRKTKLLSTVPGALHFKEWPDNKSIYICGHYSGLSVYIKEGKKPARLLCNLEGFKETVAFMEIDRYENLWVSHALRGLYRLRLNKSFTEIVEKEYYGGPDKETDRANTYVLKFEDEVVFSTTKGYYEYDVIKNDFKPHNTLNTIMEGTEAYRFNAIGDKTWYVNNAAIGYIQRSGNKYSKVEEPFRTVTNEYVPGANNIFELNDSTFTFSSYTGLSMLHLGVEEKKKKFFRPELLSVSAISNADTLYFSPKETDVEIPYTNNFIQVTYQAPNYSKQECEYYYSLKGNIWHKINNQTLLISKLESGEYELRVRAVYGPDSEYTSAPFLFTVQKQWYLKTWAMLVWSALIIGLILVARYVYFWRIQRAELLLRSLKEEELIKQQEAYERNTLENQQRIILLEKEQLESDVRFKSKELANMVITNIDKNEVLAKVKTELARIQKEGTQKLSKKNYTQIIQLLNQNLSSEADWNVFEVNFNNAYEGFFKKIKSSHPVLTPNDLRMCAYLRMNLSSKEIAPLLNISVRSVEVSRYRLRKKLEIEHDKNLIDYILEIS